MHVDGYAHAIIFARISNVFCAKPRKLGACDVLKEV